MCGILVLFEPAAPPWLGAAVRAMLAGGWLVLRHRREDIMLLANHFARRMASELKK